MDHLKKLLEIDPFLYKKKERDNLFYNAVMESFDYQIKHSKEFKTWSKFNNVESSLSINSLEDLPFFPSTIFKHTSLSSSKNDFKTIKSSGTSSQIKSTIFLDKENAKRQTIVLGKILSYIFGKKRKPFLVVDADPSVDYKNNELSARFAGMSGYLMAASRKTYILSNSENNLDLDIDELKEILVDYSHDNQPLVMIGYTYLIFEKLLLKLESENCKISLPKDTIFVHFGGWKKLKDKKISKVKLNKLIEKYLNIKNGNIVDIYGFTEQLGTVYPSHGAKGSRVPAYSEVIVRDTQTLKPVKDGDVGFLQFISPIPISYPGLSILNDDLGRIVSRINNKVEFEVIGRPEDAEPRGCGDTLPENFLI